MNIVTILLGLSVGATTSADKFLNLDTLKIVLLGLIAFSVGTAGGVLFGKLMYIFTKGKVNPLIGSAGVSAVPMAARVSQKEGQRENPSNFLLMHRHGTQCVRRDRFCRSSWHYAHFVKVTGTTDFWLINPAGLACREPAPFLFVIFL